MWYHTFLKYWDVAYYYDYGEYYITPNIMSRGALIRKEARRYAEQYMRGASLKDIDDLSDFYKQNIRNE